MSHGIERRDPAEVERAERASHVASLEALTAQVRRLREALEGIAGLGPYDAEQHAAEMAQAALDARP